jgi:alpha-glucosidase
MVWSGEAFPGFSAVKAWLPLSPHHASLNVAHQSARKGSLLSFYRER